MGRGLSREQVQVIRSVGETLIGLRAELERHRATPEGPDPDGRLAWLRRDLHWGAPWRRRKAGTGSASRRASRSRCLRRLEARGLVVRNNECGDGPRTTNVLLTEAGWEAFRRLTDRDVSGMLADAPPARSYASP